MAHQLKLSHNEVNRLKLSTMIEMADELENLHKDTEKKVMGNPNDFKI